MMKNQKIYPHKENKNALELALRYLAYQPRSGYEMREYLTKKGFNEDIVNHTVEMLLAKKYLDDVIFTRNFVESRINNKSKSKFALAYELNKKGIEPVIIEDVLKEYDDYNLALKAIEARIQLWAHLDSEKYNKKILNFLKNRGFNYDISISLLSKLKSSE